VIKKIKLILKQFISLVILKKSNSIFSKNIPLINLSSKITNNKTLIFNGICIIEEGVIIKNKKGSIELNNNVYVRRFVKIQNLNGLIKIGSNTTINEFTILQSNEGSIIIGDDVRIAPYVKIFAENHIFNNKDLPIHQQGLSSKGIVIGNNVWIGTGAIILDGIMIGDNVVIGAGSVVTKSFGNNQVIAGNPAKYIKDIYIEK
jgi:acetyltransferase-like isoleucine patch superfamily enzyme